MGERKRAAGEWVVWVSHDDAQTWRQVGLPRSRWEAIDLGRNMRVDPRMRVAVMRVGEMPRR